jgi:hypothetical protein
MDTKGEMSSPNRPPQSERKHPPEWESDLNPDHLAGQNVGTPPSDRELALPTAFDHKEIHRALRDFNDEELKQIPILGEGTPLQQGATYIDLDAAPREEFKYNAGKRVERGHHYVAKDRVPYWIWNRLIGEPK